MHLIFTVIFIILGLINHEIQFFSVAGLFAIASSIDIVGVLLKKWIELNSVGKELDDAIKTFNEQFKDFFNI